MPKYISKPTVVEAMQWTGDNFEALLEWAGVGNFDRDADQDAALYVAANKAWLQLEVGEWVMKDSIGFYPCKDSIFKAKYEILDDPLRVL